MATTHNSIPKSNILELIKKRYSCRKYLPEPVAREHQDLLAQAVRWAPSACNRQPYNFLFITDRDTIENISKAVPTGPESINAWIATAPLIVAAVGRPELFWHKLTQVIDKDYHRTDAAIAMDHLSLVATELGLGTCWVGWFHRRKVGRILDVSRGDETIILMTVGYPDKEAPRAKIRKELDELIVNR